MSMIVFWLFEGDAYHKPFTDLEMSGALAFANTLRRTPEISHVTIAPEPDNLVGKMGVDSVEDGKTPDGQRYEWRKRR